MTIRRVAAALGYGVTAVISLVLGSVYLVRGSFMPHHADALGLAWSEVEPTLQTLLLALLDVAGAGWIALGLAVLALTLGPMRGGERWSRWLIPALLLVFYVPTLLATLRVLQTTPASPPWWGNATACAVTSIALILDRPWEAPAKE